MTDEGKLAGRVAVVTGAGRGLGLAFVRRLAQAGATAIIGELDESLGWQAADALAREGLAVRFMPLDVTDPQRVEDVAGRALAEHGRLDIWINNAGVARHQPSLEVTPQLWQLSLGVMLSGTFYGCQAAGRIMAERGGGCIINVASVNGLVAQAGRAGYCAAKAGVIRLTEVLAAEWAPYNIRVNAVAPAVFLTDLALGAIQAGSASLEGYVARTPARRLGPVPELAEVVAFLASDDAAYLTGQTLRVDGGWASDHYL
jgi:NAD(P)-dependent dehydrogenase (short-subunit alcohol dehydrogenase family)